MSIPWRPNIRVDIDPDARKDFTFDFAQWVPQDTEILGHEVVTTEGVTVDQVTRVGAEVTFWVSGVAQNLVETVTVRMTLDTSPVFSDDFSLTFRGRQQ